MKIRTFIALVLLGLSAAAYSDIVSQAYEVSLSDFRAPATENGGIAFKPCSDCERRIVRVTSATRYAISGKKVRLKDFRKAVVQADDRDEKSVTVLHHLESNTIESLDLVM